MKNLNNTQRTTMIGIYAFSIFLLYWFITQVTITYIGQAYPEVSGTTVTSLITLPSLFGMFASFLIAPIALTVSTVTLSCVTIGSVVVYCLIFFINGTLHGPFWLYVVAAVFGGWAQGTFNVVLNSLIAKHFPKEERGAYIAKYNVFLNVGALIVLQMAGIVAAQNDGATWYNTYLLGVFPLVGLIIFAICCKKVNANVPTIVEETAGEEVSTEKPKLKDVPKAALLTIVCFGLAHALFYISQYAFNTNVAAYIITEYQLGTSAQAGTASSMVRLSLIVFTALYPVLNKVLKKWMVPIGYSCSAIGLLIMMLGKSIPAACLCGIFIGMSTALSYSAVYAKASSYVPVLMVPIAMSLVSGITNIGQSSSVYIFSFFSSLMGGSMNSKFLVGIVCSLLAAAFATYMFVIRKSDDEAAA